MKPDPRTGTCEVRHESRSVRLPLQPFIPRFAPFIRPQLRFDRPLLRL